MFNLKLNWRRLTETQKSPRCDKNFFDSLVWKSDRMILGDLVFRLEHYKNDDWDLGNNCFSFYKIKHLIDQYSMFLSSRSQFNPRNILELGIWDGGSIAFWFEYFQPRNLVGVDIMQRDDSDYFKKYISSKGLKDYIRTYWGVDQRDSAMLNRIISTNFSGSLDLVIDDASHIYEATKSSFETLFPHISPGGLYIIEDWSWRHWKGFLNPDHPMIKMNEPTKLVFELIEATGSSTDIISRIDIFQGFVAVERGKMPFPELKDFRLNDYIYRL